MRAWKAAPGQAGWGSIAGQPGASPGLRASRMHCHSLPAAVEPYIHLELGETGKGKDPTLRQSKEATILTCQFEGEEFPKASETWPGVSKVAEFQGPQTRQSRGSRDLRAPLAQRVSSLPGSGLALPQQVVPLGATPLDGVGGGRYRIPRLPPGKEGEGGAAAKAQDKRGGGAAPGPASPPCKPPVCPGSSCTPGGPCSRRAPRPWPRRPSVRGGSPRRHPL